MHQQLDQQKETTWLLVKNYMLYVIVFVPLTIILYALVSSAVEYKGLPVYLILCFVATIVSIIFLFLLIYFIRLRIAFNKVTFVMEDTKEIVCTNIRLIILPSRNNGFYIAGFIFADEHKKKYYYIFPEERLVHLDYIKFVKSKSLGHQLTIKHYAGTNLIIEPPFTLYDYEC